MNCYKIKKQLSAYLDKETSSELTEHISAHLDACDGCTLELERLQDTYAYINVQADLPLDPFMATRVKAIAQERRASPLRPFAAMLQKAAFPTVVFAGLCVGIFLGMQLKHVMTPEQANVAEQTPTAPQQIDENMFTTTPSGSITASYITLTSARQ